MAVMIEALETRELITLDGSDVWMRGTYHRPYDDNSEMKTILPERDRLGVVFLNSLSVPRASTGDSAVYWADAFAGCGYPSFRLDLPGLGDTFGQIPNELLDYINAGNYAAVTASKLKELVDRYALSGVVVVGHCAGALTAVFAASGCKEVKGLIMMDPYFHLPQAVRPKARQGLSDWARRTRFGGFLSNIYDRARELQRRIRRNSPPKNANFALLARWKQVASTGLPILMIKAPGLKSPGIKPRTGEFDYLRHALMLAGNRRRIVIELIEGTDHSFADRAGRAAVRQRIKNWLTDQFPQAGADESVQRSSFSGNLKTDVELTPSEHCLSV
jgi:pimeloyl-ACP methyl ester carboxylesterase